MKLREKIGDYILDISKLIFGGVILGPVLSMEFVSKSSILIISVTVVFALSLFGFSLIKER